MFRKIVFFQLIIILTSIFLLSGCTEKSKVVSCLLYTSLQSKIQDAILKGGLVQYIYRVWNDNKNEYRWIRLDGSVETQADNTKFLYGVYSDVNKRDVYKRQGQRYMLSY